MWLFTADNDGAESKESGRRRDKFMAALFYGMTSLAVIFTNKAVMSQHHFPYPEFVAAVQFVSTTVILSILIFLNKIDVPVISYGICRDILPISAMFLGNIIIILSFGDNICSGNVICGLGSTSALNLPMFTALRRFSILMTMIAEWSILGNKPTMAVTFSVAMMVGGAMFAAVYDLSFDMSGYLFLFLNNLFTALNGVYLKKASTSGKCSKLGVLFYNSLFSAIAMIIFFIGEYYYVQFANAQNPGLRAAALTRQLIDTSSTIAMVSNPIISSPLFVGDSSKVLVISTLTKVFQYDGWHNLDFLCLFATSAVLGSVLNYSIFLCTTLNSALTTSVVGCLKNVATTYVGMIVFSDYSFNWLNFIGLNISIAGSLYYTYVTLFKGQGGYGGG